MNLNHVQLAGRLTRDPDNRYTQSGVAITDIGIAVSRFFKNDQGETKEETDFIDVTAFGRTAEIVQKHRSFRWCLAYNRTSWGCLLRTSLIMRNWGSHFTMEVAGPMVE